MTHDWSAFGRGRRKRALAAAVASMLNGGCASRQDVPTTPAPPARVANEPPAPASGPLAPANEGVGASGDKKECSDFRSRYRSPWLAATGIQRVGALRAGEGKGRTIAILDAEGGGDAVRRLQDTAAGGDSWRSPALASLAVDLRKTFATEASLIQELVAALERRDVAAYRSASDRLNEQEQVLGEMDARFLDACADRLSPEGGRLPPEVIQAVVRAHYDVFRHCYEAGLARNPALRGAVQVRFIIDKTGVVESVEPFADVDSKSPLRQPELEAFWRALDVYPPSSTPLELMPDPEVVTCMVEHYRTLVFPIPEGNGHITVVYPIMFSPDPPTKQ